MKSCLLYSFYEPNHAANVALMKQVPCIQLTLVALLQHKYFNFTMKIFFLNREDVVFLTQTRPPARFLSSNSNEIRFCEEDLSSSLEGSGALTNTAVQLTPADHIPGSNLLCFLLSVSVGEARVSISRLMLLTDDKLKLMPLSAL